MKSRLPTLDKLPKDYIFWLYKEVNKEDTAEVEMPPIPEYTKERMTFTETAKSAFGYLIGNLSV